MFLRNCTLYVFPNSRCTRTLNGSFRIQTGLLSVLVRFGWALTDAEDEEARGTGDAHLHHLHTD